MSTTLFGHQPIPVNFAPNAEGITPPPGEVRVRQIPVREYREGFQHYHDEEALVAFLVGQPREFALSLAPESYEEILAVGTEVNQRGFFASCQRRMAAEEEIQTRAAGRIAGLPENQRKVILEAGANAMSQTSSPASSFKPPRPRA